ncbi:helix-turn-helix domain-containing protein [Rhizobium rhizosphaerae]|nr:helix-turn-helix domain-containing protein [Xaviernesmea rhizosphaerae]
MMLTEPEVAERLRCSTSKIKRLRAAGKLAYLPGRPVLIDERDLDAFISGQKRIGRELERPSNETAANTDEAREWALAQVLGLKKK